MCAKIRTLPAMCDYEASYTPGDMAWGEGACVVASVQRPIAERTDSLPWECWHVEDAG